MENGIKDNPELLALLERYFNESESTLYPNRLRAERDRDYVDGKQLSAEEFNELKRRGQPPVVINRIRRKIDWLLGLAIKQRQDPMAHPRTPMHEEHAESITSALRFVCDNEKYDAKFLEMWSDFLVEGFGGMEVIHETVQENGKDIIEVRINHYPWDRLFYDPYSRRSDFSDARYKGSIAWIDLAEFEEMYPQHKDNVSGIKESAGTVIGETYDDRPHRNLWYDHERNRIRLVLIWYRKNQQWHWAKYVGSIILDGGISPYLDDKGATLCPLIMQSAYCDRENNRYGIVRDMIDPQDEINKRRSKALHIASSRQTMGIEGAVKSIDELKLELAKPDGHIEIQAEAWQSANEGTTAPFSIIPVNDQMQQQLGLMHEAKNEIDLMGSNSALAGEAGTRTSGRAILARQQGGMIEINALVQKSHDFSVQIYRHIWFMVKQTWTEERWVRVTDEEKSVRFVGLNRPLTLREKLTDIPPEEAVAYMEQAGITSDADPRLDEDAGIANPIQDIDVDIVIDQSPDQVTLESETYEAMLQHAQFLPPAALIQANPAIPSHIKRDLIKQLNTPQQPSEQELADVEKTKSEAELNEAKTAEAQAKALEILKGKPPAKK